MELPLAERKRKEAWPCRWHIATQKPGAFAVDSRTPERTSADAAEKPGAKGAGVTSAEAAAMHGADAAAMPGAEGADELGAASLDGRGAETDAAAAVPHAPDVDELPIAETAALAARSTRRAAVPLHTSEKAFPIFVIVVREHPARPTPTKSHQAVANPRALALGFARATFARNSGVMRSLPGVLADDEGSELGPRKALALPSPLQLIAHPGELR